VHEAVVLMATIPCNPPVSLHSSVIAHADSDYCQAVVPCGEDVAAACRAEPTDMVFAAPSVL
jgi:hypothetical protein